MPTPQPTSSPEQVRYALASVWLDDLKPKVAALRARRSADLTDDMTADQLAAWDTALNDDLAELTWPAALDNYHKAESAIIAWARSVIESSFPAYAAELAPLWNDRRAAIRLQLLELCRRLQPGT